MRAKTFLIAVACMLGMPGVGTWAADEITSPAATPVVVWDEGAMNENIEFSWSMGCSGYSVTITRSDNNSQLYYDTHGVATTNPEVYPYGPVSDPSGASGTEIDCVIKVVYTNTMGIATTLTRNIKIKNQ